MSTKRLRFLLISYFLLLALLTFIVFAQSAAASDNYKNESNATTPATDTTALEKLSLLDKLVARTDAIIKSLFGTSPEVTQTSETIEILDSKSSPVISDIKTYDETKKETKKGKTSSISVADIPDKGELEVDAIDDKNVAVKLKVNTASKGEIILDDFGSNNPVSVSLPGRVVKYVEISANNISFSSADVTIRYSDAELNGGSENDLTIYHWNGASWEALPTIVDMANKTLSASTTSLSPFGVATSYVYYFENNATNQSAGADGITNFSATTITYPVIGLPYKNLLKNGTMGTTTEIGFKSINTAGITYEAFRFYLPFNYTMNTNISANVAYNITWNAAGLSDPVSVSLIDYNPMTGAKKVIGVSTISATSPGSFVLYQGTIPNTVYTIQKGNRLMVNISVVPKKNTVSSLRFNDTTSSYITIIENGTGGGVNLTSTSSLSSTTTPQTNSTYYLNLINNGTVSDTYTITTSNPDGATTAATNITTSFTLNAGASRVFTLNVTNTSANATPFRVNVTVTAANSSQFGYINTTTTVATVVSTYIPTSPTNLANITGNFFVNQSWQAGSTGNITNSYNVSVNGTWTNGSSNTYKNTSVNPHGWSNISVYSFNSSGIGTLNTTAVSQNTQVANNPVTIGNVSGSYTLTAGNTLAIYPTSSDLDNDTPVFARNFTNGTFYTNNGTLLWTTTISDSGNHSWQINVSDGNSSVSAVNFTVTVNILIDTSFTVSLPIGETKAWFNASLKTQTNVTARNQTGNAGFLNIANTGNVNENFYFNITSALPSGVTLKAGIDNNSAGATAITTTSTIIVSGLVPSSSHYVWLWANFVNASPMDAQRTLQFNSSQ